LIKQLIFLTVAAFITVSTAAAVTVSANDSWLPETPAAPVGTPGDSPGEVNELLKTIRGPFRPAICQYNGNKLLSATPFAGGKASVKGAEWRCEVKPAVNPADPAGKPDPSNLTITFTLVAGEAKSAGVAVAFDFNNWTTDNYILVPAVLYGGNRFRVYPVRYPPYIHNAADRPLDMPVTTTDIPHLKPDGAHAKVEMMTGNAATPMMSFFNPAAKRAFILLTEQGTRFGNNGLFVEEDAAGRQMTFAVAAPCVRTQRYIMCGHAGSGDRGADFKPGDEVTLKFKLFNIACADLPAFYDQVFTVRKALSGANRYACVTPYSAAADLIVNHFDQDKWFDDGQWAHYCNSRGNNSPFHSQIGWNGVPIYSYPASLLDTPLRRERVGKSLDFLVQAQGKTGLFYAMLHKGNVVGDWGGRSVTMTRRTADVVTFGVKQLELLKKRGQPVKPEWEAAVRKGADALVKVWNDYGQFGQFIDADTGTMQINGSTAGIACAGALALASHYFKNPGYLTVAEASGKLYYERDFAKGYAGGGAAEILQSPDSEAPWDGGEAYMALYDVTGNPQWLECAKLATAHLATWMVSYDYQFPEGSAMGQAGTHAAGSIFASSQNNHSAPGLYILSGDFLLKLFRATGDRRVAELYRDTAHNVIQYVGAPHNPLRTQSGYVTERVQLSDWEGGNIGHVDYRDSNMAWEILAALTCLENPGIYLRTDDDTFLVLDHVEARVVKRGADGVTLEITNPTQYDAKVSLLAESAAQARQPLAVTACLAWPKVEIKAGETKQVTVSPDGKVTGASVTGAAVRQPQPGDADYPTPIPSARHAQKVQEVKSREYGLVLVGDSITQTLHNFGGKDAPMTGRVWNRDYAPHRAINLGHNGNRTENILWYLQNGEFRYSMRSRISCPLRKPSSTGTTPCTC